jgi:Ca2+/Na+ antiporter
MEDDRDRSVHGKGLGILKAKRHVLFVTAVVMIVALVILHIVFANSIYKAGRFSVKNPLSYVMIGGFLLLAALKLKHLWRSKNSIGKHFKK